MLDELGNKYLLIKLSYETSSEINYSQINDSQWSLVSNEDFYYSYWLSKEDYEIYRIWDMRKKFFNKGAKLNEKKLFDKGFIKAIGITNDQAYDWLLDYLRIKPLKEYIISFQGREKEKKFWDFVDQACLREEVYIIEAWMRLTYAKVWCQQNDIAYRVDITPDYPEVLPKGLRKEIIAKIKENNFNNEFYFMNNILGSIK